MQTSNALKTRSIIELMKGALDLNDSWVVDDLHRAISVYRDDDPDTPGLFNSIGDVFMERYKEGHNSTDLETAISSYKRSLRLTTELDPERGTRLSHLGLAFWKRFQSTGRVPDIDGACSCYERCLLDEPAGTRRCGWLGNHGSILLERFGRTGNMSDLARAITVLQDVVDMASEADLHHADLNNLGTSLQTRFERLGDIQDLQAAVTAQQKAVDLTPDDHPDKASQLGNLGTSLQTRFEHLGDIQDLQAAIAAKRKAIDLTPDGHPDKASRFNNLGSSLQRHFERLGDIQDLQAAIAAQRKAIDLTPDGHPDKAGRFNNLGSSLQRRFEHLGDIQDLQAAITAKRKAIDLTPDGHPSEASRFNNLGNSLQTRFEHLGDIQDLQAAVTAQRKAVEHTPDGHPSKAGWFSNLGTSLQRRFERLGDIQDLQAAITAQRKAVDLTPDGHPDKAGWFSNLGGSLLARFGLLFDISDRDASIHMFRAAAQSPSARPNVKLGAARVWSNLAHSSNDKQETLCAYDCAMSLIPLTAWMGTAIQDRHWQLEQVGDFVRDAAAAAARYGEPDMALEWLEQGRSVVWGQIINLRSPLHSLRAHHPLIAEGLTTVSCDLDANANDRDLTDDTRRDKHRALSLEWDQLISEVRSFDGFEDFLGSKKISQLLPAASSFPIVVVNAHKAGCDALVLIAGADGVIHIPLDFTFGKAELLLDSLEKAHFGRSLVRHSASLERHLLVTGSGAVPRNTNDRVRELLAGLWCAIVKPVLDGLAFSLPDMQSDDLPRICWCPTGPLAFLPIHAAGDYTTEAPGTKIFEFVVSSYTPTVTALLQPTLVNPGNPKVLAVAQSKYTGRRVSVLKETMKEVKIVCSRARANSIETVVLEDNDGTVLRVLDEMAECNWIHLACHGSQDICDPTKGAFLLADGDLKLDEIIKHPLPHAEFAFLSACQTATGDQKLAEEAVHLAAGMLLAGYRSVIATMWSINDEDGPKVADEVYAELFRNGRADYTRAPYALHNAVHKLRSNGAPFLAWMPFIHMGQTQPSLQAETFKKRPQDGVAQESTVSERMG